MICLAFSPDGQLLADGGSDPPLRLWSLADGQPIRTAQELRARWAIRHEPGRISGRPIKTVEDLRAPVTCLAFSPDGKILASGDKGQNVHLWTSNLLRLSELPIAEASRSDFDWAQATLRDGKTTDSERRALEFMVALMQLQRRFEIEIDEPTRRTGRYDIEIDG
jgi:WD40 repeat protein